VKAPGNAGLDGEPARVEGLAGDGAVRRAVTVFLTIAIMFLAVASDMWR